VKKTSYIKNLLCLCARLTSIFGLVFVAILLNSCTKEPVYHQVQSTRFAMGTVIEMTVLDTLESKANEAIDEAFDEILRIASLFYEGNPQSPLYAFNNRKNNETGMPVEVLELIQRSLNVSEKTNGAFDITVGVLLPLYRFGGDSLIPPDSSTVKELLPFVDYKNLKINYEKSTLSVLYSKIRVTTGGIAKGYAVDRAIEILLKKGVAGALINAGGDLRVISRKDGKPWCVGIQNPRKPNTFINIIEISEGAVATSGDYQKYYFYKNRRIHHLLNPKTGFPADSCQSVTVIAPTTELADALATGLFVAGVTAGLDIIKKYPNCEALWVRADGKTFMSKGFERYLVTLN